MSTNITPEIKLRALIAIDPASKGNHPLDSGSHGVNPQCALQRAAVNAKFLGKDLNQFAQTLGFNWEQSTSIMYGWDIAAGIKNWHVGSWHSPEHLELGKALFREYGHL